MHSKLTVKITFWIVLVCLSSNVTAAPPPKKWQGSIPTISAKPEQWKALTETLVSKKMYFGAMAAAHRMLLLFPDVEVKELAHRLLIRLIDAGYPYILHADFANADIEPSNSYDFVNSYYLYKGIANSDAGTPRWAKFYFEKVDRDGFQKYLFFSALQSYAKRDLDGAESSLKKILNHPSKTIPLSLLSKVSRTLARIYFEREQYEKSLDVYRAFLLKLNPMTPSDWLESAWNLYHLKRYDEALGHLYNLDTGSSVRYATLERFVLRALVYRDMCATDQIKALAASFETSFKSVINGIKGGEELKRFPVLRTISMGKGAYYAQLNGLKTIFSGEAKEVESLGDVEDLGRHLYDSELANLTSDIQLYEEEALRSAASYLVNLHESIKFLGFDVVREIYNPDRVFKEAQSEASKPLMQEAGDDRFLLRWEQIGAYWRDEKLTYRASLKNTCVGAREP